MEMLETGGIKTQKRLHLERKNTKKVQENRRLGFKKSPHVSLCEAAYAPKRRPKRCLIFKITRIGSMVPKEIKYNLQNDDVRRDFLRPPHGTTPATVE